MESILKRSQEICDCVLISKSAGGADHLFPNQAYLIFHNTYEIECACVCVKHFVLPQLISTVINRCFSCLEKAYHFFIYQASPQAMAAYAIPLYI